MVHTARGSAAPRRHRAVTGTRRTFTEGPVGDRAAAAPADETGSGPAPDRPAPVDDPGQGTSAPVANPTGTTVSAAPTAAPLPATGSPPVGLGAATVAAAALAARRSDAATTEDAS
jgi:hypothetical protein